MILRLLVAILKALITNVNHSKADEIAQLHIQVYKPKLS